DDFVHISARAEIAAGAGDHHRLHLARVDKRAECVAQLGVAFEGQRILALRAVERDRRHAIREAPQKVLRAKGRGSEAHALVPPSMVIAAPLMSRLKGRHSMAMTLPIVAGSTSRPHAFILV